MYANSSISYDWSDNSRPTTSGPGARDPRYCAPEVFEWESRNESADIWSLGCVFLEMQSVLLGHNIADIRSHFESCGTRATWYHKNEDAVITWFQVLLTTMSAAPCDKGIPLEWITKMVVFNRDLRICIDDLVESILGPSRRGKEIVERYCGKCCIDAYQESNNSGS